MLVNFANVVTPNILFWLFSSFIWKQLYGTNLGMTRIHFLQWEKETLWYEIPKTHRNSFRNKFEFKRFRLRNWKYQRTECCISFRCSCKNSIVTSCNRFSLAFKFSMLPNWTHFAIEQRFSVNEKKRAANFDARNFRCCQIEKKRVHAFWGRNSRTKMSVWNVTAI